MTLTLNRYFSLFALLVLLAACATAPLQEMSDARQAVMAAKEAGAEEHASALYSEARQLMEDANAFIGERRFELARVVAGRAKRIAIKARREALNAQAYQAPDTTAPSRTEEAHPSDR